MSIPASWAALRRRPNLKLATEEEEKGEEEESLPVPPFACIGTDDGDASQAEFGVEGGGR